MRNKKSFVKTFFKIFFFAFIFSGIGLFLDNSALAQENVEIKLDKSKMKTVATVNIYDAKIVSQDNNRIKISFDLSNREYVQPDVKYLVQLIREDKDANQLIIDEFV